METLNERILRVLEANDALCLDNVVEREQLCDAILDELKIIPTTQMYADLS